MSELKFKVGDRVETTKRSACKYVPSGQFGTVVGIDYKDSESPYFVKMDDRERYPNSGFWFAEQDLKLAGLKEEPVKEKPFTQVQVTVRGMKASHSYVMNEQEYRAFWEQATRFSAVSDLQYMIDVKIGDLYECVQDFKDSLPLWDNITPMDSEIRVAFEQYIKAQKERDEAIDKVMDVLSSKGFVFCEDDIVESYDGSDYGTPDEVFRLFKKSSGN